LSGLALAKLKQNINFQAWQPALNNVTLPFPIFYIFATQGGRLIWAARASSQ
jgi:hypothetical protein